MCRRQNSAMMMTIDASQNSLVFSDKKNLSIYPSSEWVERGFCNRCGTTLFWRSRDFNYCAVNVFALNEQPEDLKLDMEIYIDHKPEFYRFANDTQKLTEAEVIALFSKDQE